MVTTSGKRTANTTGHRAGFYCATGDEYDKISTSSTTEENTVIEQKLDRIIELLEIIAEGNPPRRVSRGQISDARRIITEHREQLRGKRITFGEFCEIIGVENTKQNQFKFGAAMTDAGVTQYRTKSARYYTFP